MIVPVRLVCEMGKGEKRCDCTILHPPCFVYGSKLRLWLKVLQSHYQTIPSFLSLYKSFCLSVSVAVSVFLYLFVALALVIPLSPFCQCSKSENRYIALSFLVHMLYHSELCNPTSITLFYAGLQLIFII